MDGVDPALSSDDVDSDNSLSRPQNIVLDNCDVLNRDLTDGDGYSLRDDQDSSLPFTDPDDELAHCHYVIHKSLYEANQTGSDYVAPGDPSTTRSTSVGGYVDIYDGSDISCFNAAVDVRTTSSERADMDDDEIDGGPGQTRHSSVVDLAITPIEEEDMDDDEVMLAELVDVILDSTPVQVQLYENNHSQVRQKGLGRSYRSSRWPENT
ncbi:hypothetical protein CONLIGDRAFT_684017 [Coniochaeta ligniaria NRRL 30616]|uniref:Uncharacterized protein n=1 Tax=Coniochaeta ligniaria NRRL 30616 TaxID=1408157 RepID=A0A1J7JCW1_9PEZI|nr:hypothetical protein CONLIGDRAFT_684017 [Coniochaeta ligniaria NRRL 30616]